MFALRSSISTAATASRRVTTASLLSGRASLSTDAPGTTPTPDEPARDSASPQSLIDFLGMSRRSEAADNSPPVGSNYPRSKPFVPTLFPMTTNEKVRSSDRYRVHCRASRNNTMVQVTEPKGRTLAWFSGGSLKFKGVNRSSYEAGYQCAVGAIRRIQELVKEKGEVQIELYFRGFGQGREAMKTALLAAEGEKIRHMITLIQDRTPIKIGGTRAPKARRL